VWWSGSLCVCVFVHVAFWKNLQAASDIVTLCHSPSLSLFTNTHSHTANCSHQQRASTQICWGWATQMLSLTLCLINPLFYCLCWLQMPFSSVIGWLDSRAKCFDYLLHAGTVHLPQPLYKHHPWSALAVAMPTGIWAPLDAAVKYLNFRHTHTHTKHHCRLREMPGNCVLFFRTEENHPCSVAAMLHGKYYKSSLYLDSFNRTVYMFVFTRHWKHAKMSENLNSH